MEERGGEKLPRILPQCIRQAPFFLLEAKMGETSSLKEEEL